jgi:peroxiredoxin Q/BCP
VLQRGARAPDFTLQDDTGTPVALHSLLAKGPVALYFYPADFTAGCTREACMVRDLNAELAAAGITVLGVSTDDVATHARFRERHALPFRLLADPERVAIHAFGADGPFGFTRRATFLIGRDATILDVVTADLLIGRHAAFLKRAIAAARSSA